MKNKPKHLYDSDPWMLAEHIPDSDIFFFQIPFSAFVTDTSYKFIKNYKKVIAKYSRFDMSFYFGEKDSFEVAESILKALIERPTFGKILNSNIIKWSDKLIKFAKQVSQMDLEKASNEGLWELYKKHDEVHTDLYTHGWLAVSVDMFHNNMTKKLKSYLYSVCDDKYEAESAFIILTAPSKKTIVAIEREEYLKIYKKHRNGLKKIQFKNISASLARDISNHQKKWGHLGYIYDGNTNPFSKKYYFDELKNLANSNLNADSVLKIEDKQLLNTRKKQQDLYKKLKINKLYKRLFGIAQDFAITKLYRRHAQLLDLYLMHASLITEIAKRLNLKRPQAQFLLQAEIKDALLKNKVDRKLINQRMKSCVMYTERNFEEIYVGKKATKLKKQLKERKKDSEDHVTGQVAYPGYVQGAVRIIIRAKDIKKMNEGDILVSIATDPDVVPAMKKAGAIVTDQGGITAHAAIVSRELGKPCIIGTLVATSIFKDGDMVEVDANRGIVRKV